MDGWGERGGWGCKVIMGVPTEEGGTDEQGKGIVLSNRKAFLKSFFIFCYRYRYQRRRFIE